jgi:hypothetical protein
LEEAWEIESFNADEYIKVGVLDTGIDSAHPDMATLMNVANNAYKALQ